MTPDAHQLEMNVTPPSAKDFQSTLDYIREASCSTFNQGRLFERLMKRYFSVDPIYKNRFLDVNLWHEWAPHQPSLDGVDIGIDLVAKEREGQFCAIQCKCYAPNTRISAQHIDSFIAASSREDFTSRIIVDTGNEWGQNAWRKIRSVTPAVGLIQYGDLAASHVYWPDLRHEAPEQLDYRSKPFALRGHQKEAFRDVINGFNNADRGKLIMACGTGKTFTALRIAERIAAVGGRVLYLVPSIALFSQAMREWAEQKSIEHRYIGICSDSTTGKDDEDVRLNELEIPVTTDPSAICGALQITVDDAMTVVFCTYQSLPIIENAQDQGAPAFDLVLCDEAHRTTGIEQTDNKLSPFVLVHDENRIRAQKRLYMTATSRLFTESARTKAAQYKREVFSMDDPETYGPEFHRLPFSKAVDTVDPKTRKSILCDYKVVILAMREEAVSQELQEHIGRGAREININDATKIVGCWQALQNPDRKSPEQEIKPLTRAIAFTSRISDSQRLKAHWNGIIGEAVQRMPEDRRPEDFKCEIEHVDGKHNAFYRKSKLEWLSNDTDGVCRILSNARCLSEGIDVPALDAVLFMTPRNSHVDIVQAVGRVMRQAEGKKFGYIILPVAIPAGSDPSKALDDNKTFAAVWGVLRALRSHDDRFDALINHIDLNQNRSDKIIFDQGDGGENGGGSTFEGNLQLWLPVDLPPDAIFPKIVEKCGDRRYWDKWAEDVANIFPRLVTRIKPILDNPNHDTMRERFDGFREELELSINPTITRNNVIDMMAQHILTQPVFDALFTNYDFSASNPVSKALDSIRNCFSQFGLENEMRDLKSFYESVRTRAQGIDNSAGRQHVLKELYETFFATATKKDAERLGIVYTPVEIVDFILHSADDVLCQEFSRNLSDHGVHILDPFAGTGIFLARLLQLELIRDEDLERKYREELHANEIVLLAYYIATVNVEEALRGRCGEDSNYEPFKGIVWTDTFNLNKNAQDEGTPTLWLEGNSDRVEHQENLPIQVIVGNPPWSAGQRSATDDNPNVGYPELAERITNTYVSHSTARNTRHLHDTYKMAIRWASDRLPGQGVIAFVTNGSWIDGNADSGVRACLAKEFDSVYVLNLRGDAYTSGERRRAEKDNVFGGSSRAPVAITILVKNPNATHGGCRIYYKDIGDYLTQKEKLSALSEAKSVSGFDDWESITPDSHHDWIRQRNEAFARFYPMGSRNLRGREAESAIFRRFSLGIATHRDSYVYNFSRQTCAENGRRMTQNYLSALDEIEQNPQSTVDEVVICHSSHLNWDNPLRTNLKRRSRPLYDDSQIRKVAYRPFVPINCYTDYIFVQVKYQMDRIFPNASGDNRLICVPGLGSYKNFSVVMTNAITDLNLQGAGTQCFPRYWYPKPDDKIDPTLLLPGIEGQPDCIDNISDTALDSFRVHYDDHEITKDDIFNYVYGILHDTGYREQFANDLSKELPRIPYATDFCTFAKAGKALAKLHLGYETCPEYPLTLEFSGDGEPQPHHYLLTAKRMRFADEEKSSLLINDHLRLSGIPAEAHQYIVNGRTPLEWYIDRYRITQDSKSGIVNDPNGWFEDHLDLIGAIKRIVFVSVESTRIINSLPSEISDSSQDNTQ